MSGMNLIKACNVLQHTLLKEAACMPKILGSACTVRHGRRTCKPPTWFVDKKIKRADSFPGISQDNRGFLKELYEDQYVDLSVNSPLKDAPYDRQPWNRGTMRTGVIGMKIGVCPQWTKTGERILCTLVQVIDNHVIRYTPPEQFRESRGFKSKWKLNNHGSLVVGSMSVDPFRYTKAYVNLFKDSGVPPKRHLSRFIITPEAELPPGTPLNATHFRVGDYVDCQAKTIDHGFQGVVKRWGMKGGPASHGSNKFHRRQGSLGPGTGKLKKGLKMPGHMGMERRTLKGLKVLKINTKHNVLYIYSHCIPGPTHAYMRIMDSSLRNRIRERVLDPPYLPTFIPELDGEDLPEEMSHETLFDMASPSIEFGES